MNLKVVVSVSKLVGEGPIMKSEMQRKDISYQETIKLDGLLTFRKCHWKSIAVLRCFIVGVSSIISN